MTVKEQVEKLRNAFASLTEAQNKIVETNCEESLFWFREIERIKAKLRVLIFN